MRSKVIAPRARKHSQWLAWMARAAEQRRQHDQAFERAQGKPDPGPTQTIIWDERANRFLAALSHFRPLPSAADALRNRAPVRARRA